MQRVCGSTPLNSTNHQSHPSPRLLILEIVWRRGLFPNLSSDLEYNICESINHKVVILCCESINHKVVILSTLTKIIQFDVMNV